MKTRFLIFTLLSSLLLFIDCNKRVLGHVTLKGTIKDFFTGKGIRSEVAVSGKNDQDSTKSIGLGVFTTDGDGNFNVKVSSVKSDLYSLYFHNPDLSTSSWHENAGRIGYMKIKKNGSVDLGTVTESNHSFYCKVSLKHTDPNYDCFSTSIIQQTNPFTFCKGVGEGAEFIHHAVYRKVDFEKNNKSYLLNYMLSGKNGQVQKVIFIPISAGNDTVSTSLDF